MLSPESQAYVSLRELARTSLVVQHVAVFKFRCDESFDSDPNQDKHSSKQSGNDRYVPRAYVVCGFFGPGDLWEKVERRWTKANKHYGVKRFHAAEVNARKGEFKGWGEGKRNSYVKRLLRVIGDQGPRFHAISCGMLVRDYERIIDLEGRAKFGHPYIACFKSCLVMIAQAMEYADFPTGDQFEVLLDRNKIENEAVRVFYKMKDDPQWPYCHRLATCAPGSSEEIPALQVADLIAYDTFRLLHSKHLGAEHIRKSLESLFSKNRFYSVYYEEKILNRLVEPLRVATCEPSGFVVSFPPPAGSKGHQEYKRRHLA